MRCGHPVYGKFTGGFDAFDLEEAKALLDEFAYWRLPVMALHGAAKVWSLSDQQRTKLRRPDLTGSDAIDPKATSGASFRLLEIRYLNI
jgi:hypothetical protein